MTHHFATPGVYIEEVTGPGVIAGVGTSTAGFIGPASKGPMNEPRRVTSIDEFIDLFGGVIGGRPSPHLNFAGRLYHMGFGVEGFFGNGGQYAYIVRVGSAQATTWVINNQAGEPVFQLRALEQGTAGDTITVDVQAAQATGAAGVALSTGTATVQVVNGVQVRVDNAAPFRPGDTVTKDETSRATITAIVGNDLTLSNSIAGLAAADTLRIANIIPAQNTFRMDDTTGLSPGTVAIISGDDANNPGNAVQEFVVIQSVDGAGFVTLETSPARANDYNMDGSAAAPVLTSQDFRLIVTPAGGTAETFDNLSLMNVHPNYVFAAVDSGLVEVIAPNAPALAANYPNALVNPVANVPIATNGQDDDPSSLLLADYQDGLDALRDIDDVNMICIPDAAAHPQQIAIQSAMIDHCLDLEDRFAILDSRLGAPPSGPGSVEEQRGAVDSERGFAALYYPWLTVYDPTDTAILPRSINVPPSGHMAGIYARTDEEKGVHKAPANTNVRGVIGLETRLSDRQQGPLNLAGVNVLRIFPGTAQVVVWGARTTVRTDVTDWRYVNIRRLLLYIEESIQEGIRWAVFEPNNLQLWQKLKRTLTEFLTRVWQSGALFGESADKAFYVRIDEGLNPDSVRALGRLYIEIGVRPSYPAEFIIVRIGLWDGGAEISEL